MNFNNLKAILRNNNYSFYHLESTNSTMEESKKILKKTKENFVVLADQQINGKGRRGNHWHSPLGNIYCSIVIKNKISLKEYFFFSMLTSISVKNTLKKLGCEEIYFKWPNDIFFKNMKFAGIILEPYYSSNNEKFVIIGLGINFISSPQNKIYKTTYIKEFINLKDYNKFLEVFFLNFFDYIENYSLKKDILILEFKNSLMFLRKNIKIKISNNENISGIFKDINQDGALILDQGKKIVHLYSGSILI